MSGRPDKLPRFGTSQSNESEPLSGVKDSGRTPSSLGVSSTENWLSRETYAWLKFLQERALELLQFLPPETSVGDAEFTAAAADPSSSIYAFVANPGRAFLRTGSGANKLQVAPGELFQLTGSELRRYKFAGTEEVTVGAGDAGNPRVDLLQMSLGAPDQDTGLCALTLSLKAGTPAASPAYPAPDAGFCAIGAVVVGANAASGTGFGFGLDLGGPTKVVHDQRMPLRARALKTLPGDYMYGSDWALNGLRNQVEKQNNGAANSLLMPYSGGGIARLLDVQVGMYDTASQDSRLTRLDLDDGGGGTGAAQILVDMAHASLGGVNTNMNGSGDNLYSLRHSGVLAHQTSTFPMFGAGPTVQANANGMGPPIWTNGRRCPFPEFALGSFPYQQQILALRYVSPGGDDNSAWGPTTFFVAEGL